VSQLSSKTVSNPDEAVKVGDKIKAKVIKVDTNSKKIALSIKAFEENLDLGAIKQEQAQVENFKEDESEKLAN
jgi:ribosomal protein S1